MKALGRGLALLVIALYLASSSASAEETATQGERIARVALSYQGQGYRWGGLTPDGFDCVGLVRWAYLIEGIGFPTTYIPGIWEAYPAVEGELLPGDVLFFENTYKPGLSHLGVYIGGRQFVHAAGEAYGVIISDLDRPYWAGRLVGAVRPWE
jgi:cell wall-associated NlpC family hydrolase